MCCPTRCRATSAIWKNFVDRLPPNAVRGSIDATLCAAAHRRTPPGIAARSPAFASFRSLKVAVPTGCRCTKKAIGAFQEDHGDTPRNWGSATSLHRKYVKPVFVAHSCELATATELSKSTNYSELARRLLIADAHGKSHLLRYLERFQKKPE